MEEEHDGENVIMNSNTAIIHVSVGETVSACFIPHDQQLLKSSPDCRLVV